MGICPYRVNLSKGSPGIEPSILKHGAPRPHQEPLAFRLIRHREKPQGVERRPSLDGLWRPGDPGMKHDAPRSLACFVASLLGASWPGLTHDCPAREVLA
jgi:hypothetical protein